MTDEEFQLGRELSDAKAKIQRLETKIDALKILLSETSEREKEAKKTIQRLTRENERLKYWKL